MSKLQGKELKRLVAEYEAIKKQKSELAKQEKEIKEAFMSHLEATGAQSVAVGDVSVQKKVSSCSLGVTLKGLKVGEATYGLIRKLLEDDKTNLLSINPKTTLLFEMQEQKDEYICGVLEGLGLELTENFGVEIK